MASRLNRTVAELSVAPAGGRLAYAQISTDINLWRAGVPFGATARSGAPLAPARFNASNRSEIDPHYSPLGDKVVFSSNRSGGSEVWVCDAEGGNAVLVIEGMSSTESLWLAYASHSYSKTVAFLPAAVSRR